MVGLRRVQDVVGRAPSAVEDVVGRASSFARDEPVLAAVAVAVLVVLSLLVLVGLFRRVRRSPGDRFLRAVSRPEAVTVLMHPTPDPDAMACALGVAHLAARAGTPATIQHSGGIHHQENRAFRTVLGLESSPVETADDLADGVLVLVDHNEPRGFPGSTRLSPYAVIDHHPGDGVGTAFTDVRPEYGSCASIVAEYLEAVGADPVRGEEEADEGDLPVEVATGLLYGILADTDHLTRGATAAEFDASAYLYPGIDEDAVARISNPAVDAETLDVKARAITARDVRGPFVVSDVGELSNVDAVPQAADELLTLEGVSAVVVVGQADEAIHLSGRSRDDRVHMGDALAAAVDGIPMSSAGGHAHMGGGQVSVPHMKGLRPDSGITREDLAERIFDALDGDV